MNDVDEDDLARIEEALGRTLPAAFRSVMLKFPQELIDAAKITDGDGNEYIDDMLIEPNAEMILEGIHDREEGWPEHLIVVGGNGFGEIYSVDISQDACPVVESGPHNDAGANSPAEEGYFEQVSADLESWVAGLVQRAKDAAAGINPIEQAQRLLDALQNKAKEEQ